MITKIRTAIIALVATFSFAASMTPTAAQAAPNNGGYQNSSEGQKKMQCSSLRTDVLFWESVANYLDDAKGKNGERAFDAAVKESERAYQAFKSAGCRW